MFENLDNNDLTVIIGALRIASNKEKQSAQFSKSKDLSVLFSDSAMKYENVLSKIENEVKLRLKT